MGAKELFDAGDLSGAIEQLAQDVKGGPRDLKSRIFLFELLCFSGDFQRAERQLDAIAQVSGEVTVEMGVQVYRNILEAEKARHGFFTSGGQPKFLLEPPPYTALHLEAVARLRENRLAEVEALLADTGGTRSPLKGQVDGKPFDELRDYDDLIAPFLEVILQKDYAWLPFEQLRSIELQSPRTLRDLIWIPAKIELCQGPLGEVFLPVQYHGSSEHPNDLVKLGRMTDWKPLGGELILGMGQRMFLIDDEDRAMLEIRKIDFAVSS